MKSGDSMKINYRQISIMVFMSFIALKFLALPSLLYVESKNMSMLVALALMLIDGIYVFVLLDLMKKSGEKNIYEFMKSCLGTVITKLVLILLILKYALVAGNISKGLEFFVVENLYTEFNWFVFVLPLMILVGFMVYKGIRNIARVGEMVCWAIVIGLIYIALKALSGIDILSFLPFFKDGFKPLVDSAWIHLSWFGSATFMFMLFGFVDFRSEKKTEMIKYIIFAILIVQLLYFVFYGLFEVTCPTHNYCISDISQFSSTYSAIDELSWLVVSMWIVAQAVQLGLYGYCMAQAIKYLFDIKGNILSIIIVVVYLLAWSFIGENTIRMEEIFFTPFASIVTFLAQYILPVVLQIAYTIKSRKKKGGEKVKEVDYEREKNRDKEEVKVNI